MTEDDGDEYKFILLVNGYEVGEFQVRGVFDTHNQAEQFADDELGRGTPYTVSSGRYYSEINKENY